MENETTFIQVVATSGSTVENTEEIAFFFIGDAAMSASDIFWDPEAGVASVTLSSVQAIS